MKLATISQVGRVGIAAVVDQGLHIMFQDQATFPGDLDYLVKNGLDFVATAYHQLLGAPPVSADDVAFLPPLRNPGKIICVGQNFHDHTAEFNMEQPDHPVLFSRFPANLIGHRGDILLPRVSNELDYEGEMVAVIGKRGKYITKADALDHVIGYSVFNDASVRDYQMRTHQWTIGKNFDATGAFGPYLVTAEELPPGGQGLLLETKLNGVTLQSASTTDMIHSVAELIVSISECMTLEAGDVIVTGTPAGVGCTRTPPIYMKSGDIVTVELEGVGFLQNSIVAE